MSAEFYNTQIETFHDEDGVPILSSNGTPLFRILTTRVDETIVTMEEFRNKLVREGRLLQPIKRAARIGWTAGMTYLVASSIGLYLPSLSWQDAFPIANQFITGSFLCMTSVIMQDRIENNLNKWESRKRVFERTFHEEISLIPERFHPRHLLGRLLGRS